MKTTCTNFGDIFLFFSLLATKSFKNTILDVFIFYFAFGCYISSRKKVKRYRQTIKEIAKLILCTPKMPSISPMATRWYSLRMWLPTIANIIIM
jgi:hypothetical protein